MVVLARVVGAFARAATRTCVNARPTAGQVPVINLVTRAPTVRKWWSSTTAPRAGNSGSSGSVIGTIGGKDLVQAGSVDPQLFWVKRLTKEDVTATFSRSQGAGGQNVNKVSTKADLRFDVVNCRWMSQPLKQAVMEREAGRINKQGELILSSQVTRSQASNFDDALARLQRMLDEAAESIKPVISDPRKAKVLKERKRKANDKRLEQKKKHQEKKSARKKVRRGDY